MLKLNDGFITGKPNRHNVKRDHFDILAKGKTDHQCKIKEALFIQELEPAFQLL